MNKEMNFLVADCVAFEDYCNLRCDYCFLQSSFKSKIPDKEKIQINNNIRKLMSMANNMNIPIFKLSGGEIFLLDSLSELIKEGNKFERFQVLTNGTLLTEDFCKEQSHLDYFCIQMTLDGHTYEMNRHRFSSATGVENLFSNVSKVIKYKIPLEINLCLTRNNIQGLASFLEYLMNLDCENIVLYPIPVREDGDDFRVKLEQLTVLDQIISQYERYKKVLPPIQYLIHMKEMLQVGKKMKGWVCWINQLVIGLQGNGDCKLCPEIGTSENIRGNLFKNTYKKEDWTSRNPKILMLKNKNNVVKLCKDCYTHYELMNLYLNGFVSDSELLKIWFFRNDTIFGYLKSLKEDVINA